MIRTLLLVLALSGAARAAGEDARAHYDAGRYEAAASAYRALAQTDPRDAALQYNLGNALFKSGRLGPAIAAYERAFARDPRDADLRANLDFALRRAGEELTPPGTPPALFLAATALSERELAGLHWLCAWAALLLVAAWLAFPTKRPMLGGRVAGVAAAWAFFGLWWAGARGLLPVSRGVIIAPRAELRNGPGASFSVGFTAPEGRRVRVLSAREGWLEVGLTKEGVKGWVEAAAVEPL